jgi:hypothetical protein
MGVLNKHREFLKEEWAQNNEDEGAQIRVAIYRDLIEASYEDMVELERMV